MTLKIRLLFLMFPGLLLLSCRQTRATDGGVLIASVNIVDVQNEKVIPNQDVLIEGKRITAIHDAGEIAYGRRTTRIEATGHYLIPGLWDMHAHPDDPEVWRMDPTVDEKDRLLPLVVVNGVTGIRDMAGDIGLVKRWREKYRQGELLAPQIVAGGPLLDGPNPMWDGSVGIDNPGQVKQVVDSLIEEGVDFLKVYSLLPRETYLALSEYARQIDYPFVGHVPFTVPPSEAARTGMKSQEHLLEILKECADRPTETFLAELNRIEDPIERSNRINAFRLDSFDPARADSLYALFKDYGIWHCPTLSMWYKNAWFEREQPKDSALTAYLPGYLRAYWTPQHNDHLQYRDNAEFIRTKQRLYRLYEQMVLAMHEEGVMLLAGTDTGANPLCHPGTGVHNELEALVAAGLSPGAALRTATLNPALFFEITEDYGTVSEGKIADLVLLTQNPLEDINAVRDITHVIRDGSVLDGPLIARIKQGLLDANAMTP